MTLLRTQLGNTLRGHRLRQRRTLRDVSGRARVSLGYLSEVERGQKEASSELLASICDALDLELADLLAEVSLELRGVGVRSPPARTARCVRWPPPLRARPTTCPLRRPNRLFPSPRWRSSAPRRRAPLSVRARRSRSRPDPGGSARQRPGEHQPVGAWSGVVRRPGDGRAEARADGQARLVGGQHHGLQHARAGCRGELRRTARPARSPDPVGGGRDARRAPARPPAGRRSPRPAGSRRRRPPA